MKQLEALNTSAPLLVEEGWQRQAQSAQQLTGWCSRKLTKTTPAQLRGLPPHPQPFSQRRRELATCAISPSVEVTECAHNLRVSVSFSSVSREGSVKNF